MQDSRFPGLDAVLMQSLTVGCWWKDQNGNPVFGAVTRSLSPFWCLF